MQKTVLRFKRSTVFTLFSEYREVAQIASRFAGEVEYLNKGRHRGKMVSVQATKKPKRKVKDPMANSLAHTKWVCKYHIVFTPKYRRKIDYWGMREDIRDIIKDLCKWKGVEIIEGKIMPDHVHLLVSIPPKYSVSSFMGYLKGKSAMMIYERHAN